MKKSDIPFKHLIYYIVALDKFRKQSLDKKLLNTKILFKTKQYDLAISDLKRYLEIPKSIKIKVQSKKSLNQRTGARIFLTSTHSGKPHIIPGTTYLMQIQPSALNNFDIFVMYIVHELCHLKLFLDITTAQLPGKKGITYLWEDEKAVDALGILSGFGDNYLRASRLRGHNPESSGYITQGEFYFLFDCFRKNKKYRRRMSANKKNNSWYKKIIQIFQS